MKRNYKEEDNHASDSIYNMTWDSPCYLSTMTTSMYWCYDGHKDKV